MDNSRTSLSVFCGSLKFDHFYETPSYNMLGSIRVRRVKPSDTPETVQMEVSVTKITEKRQMTQAMSIGLSPKLVPYMVQAMNKLHAPYYGSYENSVDADHRLRAFYGLPSREETKPFTTGIPESMIPVMNVTDKDIEIARLRSALVEIADTRKDPSVRLGDVTGQLCDLVSEMRDTARRALRD